MMNKTVVKYFLGVILSLSLFSCGLMGIRDLNKQIKFFESKERDSRLFGSWKKVPTYERDVNVIVFKDDGRFEGSKGFDKKYLRYYTKTKEQKLYRLLTSNHTSHPVVDIDDYAINGDTLIVISQNGVKSTYVKLWDDESLVD